MLTRSQILRALRSAARQLGHAPTRAEFLRLTGIHHCKLLSHFRGYRAAVRAAGLSPDPGGIRIGTADLLADWARLARKKGRVPTRDEYERQGRYASASLENRFHRWTQVPSAFLKFADSTGLSEQWSDVVGIIHNGPMPTRGGGRRWLKGWNKNDWKKNDWKKSDWKKNDLRKNDWQKADRKKDSQIEDPLKSNSSVPAVAQASAISMRPAGVSVLPPPLHGMKCVTLTMLAILFPDPSASSLRSLVPRRVFPDRPLLGPPLGLPGFMFEPVNEMGVVLLFGMLFWRLGFIIESAQMGYPDCRAKFEVEPGRWQDVNLEFEHQSRHFLAHRHDSRRADFIVCWIHNWKGCPPNLQVIELREVVRKLLQLPHSQLLSF